MAKNPRLLELGPANIYITTLPRASLLYGYPSVNSEIFFQSVRPGAGFDVNGDQIDYSGDATSIQIAKGTLAGGVHAPTVVVTGQAILITVDTGGGTIADDVIAAIGQNPQAAFLVTAARGVGSNGQGFITNILAATFLTGGDGPAIRRDVGFLGDEVSYQVTTEAANLTGAQTGNVPQDKVVIGGMVKVVIPFKEISLTNFQAGVPSARVVQNADGSTERVDFAVAVGQSMRQTLTVFMEIIKLKGGFESPLPEDKIVIPAISPAEGEVQFPFAPVTQRQIMTNWYAWPDPVTGRWAYTGDENP